MRAHSKSSSKSRSCFVPSLTLLLLLAAWNLSVSSTAFVVSSFSKEPTRWIRPLDREFQTTTRFMFPSPTTRFQKKNRSIHTRSSTNVAKNTKQTNVWNVIVGSVLLLVCVAPWSPLAASAWEDKGVVPTTSTTRSSPSVDDRNQNPPSKNKMRKYWTIMNDDDSNREEKIRANEALMDYAVGTINTVYYDNSGGAHFLQEDFYNQWKHLRNTIRQKEQQQQLLTNPTKQYTPPTNTNHPHPNTDTNNDFPSDITFATREGVVKGLKYIVSTLHDPFSAYLTRDELKKELEQTASSGFLGLGAVVELPSSSKTNFFARTTPTFAIVLPDGGGSDSPSSKGGIVMNAHSILDLPVVTAVAPYSKAERSGIVVGDRIVSVDDIHFLSTTTTGSSSSASSKEKNSQLFQSILQRQEDSSASYSPDTIVVAKPIYRTLTTPTFPQQQQEQIQVMSSSLSSSSLPPLEQEVIIGYRPTKLRLIHHEPEILVPEQTLTADFATPTNRNSVEFVINGNPNTFQQPQPILSTITPLPPQQQQKQQHGDAKEENTILTNNIISNSNNKVLSGGDTIVHYELLSPSDSIFGKSSSLLSSAEAKTTTTSHNDFSTLPFNNNNNIHTTNQRILPNGNPKNEKVGYIRLTRFSKGSTDRYIHAIDTLEKAGATSYIIDIRNNYGGVIQEALLTASTLIRDPHAVLCYTLNTRGSFTPHDVIEYILDQRYPGYLLSSESKNVAWTQLKKEYPNIFNNNINKEEMNTKVNFFIPSSFASLSEQVKKRGIHPIYYYTTTNNNKDRSSDNTKNVLWNAVVPVASAASSSNINGNYLHPMTTTTNGDNEYHRYQSQLRAQKKIVILINEGTASSAEVFASALHDNKRTVALIGTRTYGKGLIQHTIPMPDGGGLRLTVAEYLTPSLHHVTNALMDTKFYDKQTGDWIDGGGIRPDIMCTETSKQGIPSNIGADYCVGMALDVLQEAE